MYLNFIVLLKHHSFLYWIYIYLGNLDHVSQCSIYWGLHLIVSKLLLITNHTPCYLIPCVAIPNSTIPIAMMLDRIKGSYHSSPCTCNFIFLNLLVGINYTPTFLASCLAKILASLIIQFSINLKRSKLTLVFETWSLFNYAICAKLIKIPTFFTCKLWWE